VSNGVDLGLFSKSHDRAEARREAGVPVNCLLFGFVGSLKPWHGVGSVLEALARVTLVLPNAHLLVIGGRRRANEYQQAAGRLGIAGRVTFFGEADHATTARLMSAMDVGLAPYLPQANFYFSPLKLYEYMAAGLCVIASGAGEIARVIHDESNG